MRAENSTLRARRGSTLIEVMAAMTVMLVGAVGVAGLNSMGVRLDGDGRRMTRATAIAEDLAQQIALWPYTDARLANVVTANDDDIGDVQFALERTDSLAGLVDQTEASLTLGGAIWYGIPAAETAGNGYERYWNVSFNDPGAPGTLLDANANATADGMRIAVIVRWRNTVGWRRIVVMTTKVNPADMQ
jgi:prepilin-type N-terminal cleavage/methylation domain-containing protein